MLVCKAIDIYIAIVQGVVRVCLRRQAQQQAMQLEPGHHGSACTCPLTHALACDSFGVRLTERRDARACWIECEALISNSLSRSSKALLTGIEAPEGQAYSLHRARLALSKAIAAAGELSRHLLAQKLYRTAGVMDRIESGDALFACC